MRRAILPLARLYQLRLRQPLTIPPQNPHRPVRKIPVRKILVVGQIYRYTFDVAVAIPMRAVVIDGDVEGALLLSQQRKCFFLDQLGKLRNAIGLQTEGDTTSKHATSSVMVAK